MTLGVVLKMRPLVQVLENRALVIVLNFVVYSRAGPDISCFQKRGKGQNLFRKREISISKQGYKNKK